MSSQNDILAGRPAFVSSPRGFPVQLRKSFISTKNVVPSKPIRLAKRSGLPAFLGASCSSRSSSPVRMSTAVAPSGRHRNDAFIHFVHWWLIVGINANDSKQLPRGGQGSSNTSGSRYSGGFSGDSTGNFDDGSSYFLEVGDEKQRARLKRNVMDSVTALIMVYVGMLSGIGLRNRSAAMIAMFSQWAESVVANLQFPCHNIIAWSFHLVYSMFLLTP